MKRYKAVFFDVGGVLLDYTAWKKADARIDKEIKRRYPKLNLLKLHRLWIKEWSKQQAHALKDFQTMRRQAEVSFYEALRQLGCNPTRKCVKEILDRWYKTAEKNVRAMPKASYVLKKLRSMGYQTGIITNADWNVVIPNLRRAGLLDLIDYKVVSSKIGAYKPQLRLFKEAIAVSKLRPEEIIYIGDSFEKDMMPAKRIGMNVLLFCREGGGVKTISALNDVLDLVGSSGERFE
ncbi:MAG: HAD family hydrolase [Thermoproteota archaeon]